MLVVRPFPQQEGRLWDRIQAVLTDRARRGVEIKIIFDDFGNITRMRGETIEAMRAEGMEVCVFNPVHQYVNRLYFNYRDHRKILCVDGQYAYTGGVNVADEYVGYLRRFGDGPGCPAASGARPRRCRRPCTGRGPCCPPPRSRGW